MINSLLYCTDNSSSLVFNGFCGKDAIGEVKNIVNRSDGFCIDDLSFNVKIDGSIYLCSPSFSRDKKKGSLRANCIILNKLFNFGFEIMDANFFIRKEWLQLFGRRTIFGKYNPKRDYVFNGVVVRVSDSCKVKVDEKCNITKQLIDISKVTKSKHRITTVGKDMFRRSLILNKRNISILDPSIFTIS